MHAASRDSLKVVQGRFDELVTDLDSSGLKQLGDELSSVVRLLSKEVLLRKHFASRAEDDSARKTALVDGVFGEKAGEPTLEVLRSAVAERWSKSRDLNSALERLAHLAVLIDAERADAIESTEDELFRFGRALDATPRLSSLLSDESTDFDGRLQLLDNVLAGKANSYTESLLKQALRLLQGRSFEVVVPELADLAANRRGESVAQVTAANALTEEQTERLERVLSQIYGRNMSVQLDIDPKVLGGLSITVGDEVVDGTVASRLASASHHVPH